MVFGLPARRVAGAWLTAVLAAGAVGACTGDGHPGGQPPSGPSAGPAAGPEDRFCAEYVTVLDVTDGHDLRRWADRISRRPMPDSTAQERAGRSVLREVISRVPPGQGLADIADPALPPSDREALGAFKGYVVRTCRPTLLETIGTHPRRSP